MVNGEVIELMKQAVNKEYEACVQEKGVFVDRHHGMGVIDEEVYEADVEMQKVHALFDELKHAIYEDDAVTARNKAVLLKYAASNLMLEAVQVAAMCCKFDDISIDTEADT